MNLELTELDTEFRLYETKVIFSEGQFRTLPGHRAAYVMYVAPNTSRETVCNNKTSDKMK